MIIGASGGRWKSTLFVKVVWNLIHNQLAPSPYRIGTVKYIEAKQAQVGPNRGQTGLNRAWEECIIVSNPGTQRNIVRVMGIWLIPRFLTDSNIRVHKNITLDYNGGGGQFGSMLAWTKYQRKSKFYWWTFFELKLKQQQNYILRT